MLPKPQFFTSFIILIFQIIAKCKATNQSSSNFNSNSDSSLHIRLNITNYPECADFCVDKYNYNEITENKLLSCIYNECYDTGLDTSYYTRFINIYNSYYQMANRRREENIYLYNLNVTLANSNVPMDISTKTTYTRKQEEHSSRSKGVSTTTFELKSYRHIFISSIMSHLKVFNLNYHTSSLKRQYTSDDLSYTGTLFWQ